MIPDYYELYNSVKMIAGKGALASLTSELAGIGVKKPIIVTDKGVMGAGLIKHVEQQFASSDAKIGAIYDETPIDSSIEAVNEIARIYRNTGCDGILAVGGGSAIDTAKGVNIVISANTDDLLKFSGNNRVRARMQPFVVIPTTAGTGSEVTMAAVIANPGLNVKMQFTSPLILPDFTLVDPRMTQTMPPHITAATGMDAMTHVVEAVMSLQRNPISDSFSCMAIELIRDNLLAAVKDGDNEDARYGMAIAALIAGVSFSNAMVGVVHATAHALGGVCHVPHGVANAIMLPHGMRFNAPVCGEALSELLLPLAGPEVYAATPASQRAAKSIETIVELNRSLNQACGMPVTLKGAGVDKARLDDVARTAICDGAANFNPIEIEYDDALTILKAAYE